MRFYLFKYFISDFLSKPKEIGGGGSTNEDFDDCQNYTLWHQGLLLLTWFNLKSSMDK